MTASAQLHGLSYSEAWRRFRRHRNTSLLRERPHYRLLDIQVMTPNEAADVARWLREVHERKSPTPEQVAQLPHATQRLLAQEVAHLGTRTHVGSNLGELRRLNQDDRWRYVSPSGEAIEYELAGWAEEPDENFLVPAPELGTSATRSRAPDGTPLPLPASPVLERRAAQVLRRLKALADASVLDVSRLCKHQPDTARLLFRHGKTTSAGLEQWDGGEFHGAEPDVLLALRLLRVVVGGLVDISPWPVVEDWEAEAHDGEHGQHCTRAWARLRRRSQRLLREAAAALDGTGKAVYTATAMHRQRLHQLDADGRLIVPYDGDAVVSTLLFLCFDSAWNASAVGQNGDS